MLPLEMKTNPGIAAISLLLSYDTDKLELISVADGKILGSSSFTPGGDVTAVPYKLNWDDLAAENNTGTGTLATASFRVKVAIILYPCKVFYTIRKAVIIIPE